MERSDLRWVRSWGEPGEAVDIRGLAQLRECLRFPRRRGEHVVAQHAVLSGGGALFVDAGVKPGDPISLGAEASSHERRKAIGRSRRQSSVPSS